MLVLGLFTAEVSKLPTRFNPPLTVGRRKSNFRPLALDEIFESAELICRQTQSLILCGDAEVMVIQLWTFVSVRDADGNAAVSRKRPEGDDDHDPQVRTFLCVSTKPSAPGSLRRDRETPPSIRRGGPGDGRVYFRGDQVQHSGGRGGEMQ